MNLSFSHHYEVRPIEDESMQDKLLDWAESENATSYIVESSLLKDERLKPPDDYDLNE